MRARFFQFGLLLLICLGGWQCRDGWPVSFDLMELVPSGAGAVGESAPAELRRLADSRVQAPLSRQVLALVEHADADEALAAAHLLAERWRASGLFAWVELEPEMDIAALRSGLLAQRVALLPAATREQWLHEPERAIRERASELADPFLAAGLVPLGQDWLGLAQHAQDALRPAAGTALSYDLGSGTLQVEADDSTAILLRAQTHSDAFDAHGVAARGSSNFCSVTLAAQIVEDRAVLAKKGSALFVAGGPLYAEQGRAQATREISWIGGVATGGIVLLLLLALWHVRALLALVPVAVGLLSGTIACVAVFGSIHILTLVIGASLIGVAVDFPLHWLGKCYGLRPWEPRDALRRVLPGLSMSLAASLIGYLALLFTPFVALTQTAVFSAAGLLGAYACTLCQLPEWMRGWRPRPWSPLLQLAAALLRLREAVAARRVATAGLVVLLLLGTVGGIQRLSMHDDLRQWLSLPPELLREAQEIGERTGVMPTSQFFLVQAADADALLRKQRELSRELDKLVERGALGAYNALSQFVAPLAEQRALQVQLAALALRLEIWRPLVDVGVPREALQEELAALQKLPLVSVDEALSGELAERWQGLWLGERGEGGEVAGLVTLLNLRDVAALHAAVREVAADGVWLIDRSGELNQLFSETRAKAAELKLLSYVAAALLLWWGFGRSAVWRVLVVPLAAVALSLAVLGWAGQPLTLFSLFGLLLVSALGVDYAIFMYEGVAGAAASLVGILLSATTTLLSFGLLVFSQTPVISGFGLSVSLGVSFSLLFAIWVKKPTGPN